MSSYTHQKFHVGRGGSGGKTSDWWAMPPTWPPLELPLKL